MGFLKHFLLPTFAVTNGYAAIKCLTTELLDMIAPGFDRDLEKQPPTTIEKALSRTIGGAKLASMVNMIIATQLENAHYRGMALIVETVYLAVDAWSAYKSGFKETTGIYTMLGLSVLGLGIHAMEPGLFTKDKNSS